MKINNEIIEEILCDLIGDDLPPLLHILLKARPNLSEFKIAEKLNITVNQVRNMLYRMQDHNLVDFVRKKDKKKGWYIYYWTLNKRNVDYAIYDYKRKQIKSLKERLSKEEITQFFVCPMGCMRVNIDNAMEHDFRCQECGTLFKEQDNQRTIENIKRMIGEIEEEIAVPPKSMSFIHKDDEEEKAKKLAKAKKAEAKALKEKKAAEAKARKEKRAAEAKAKKEKRVAEAKARKEKRVAEAKKRAAKAKKKAAKKKVKKAKAKKVKRVTKKKKAKKKVTKKKKAPKKPSRKKAAKKKTKKSNSKKTSKKLIKKTSKKRKKSVLKRLIKKVTK